MNKAECTAASLQALLQALLQAMLESPVQTVRKGKDSKLCGATTTESSERHPTHAREFRNATTDVGWMDGAGLMLDSKNDV